MKNYFKLLMMLIIIGFTTSCSDTEGITQLDYQDKLSETRYANTYTDYDVFWRYGLEYYGVDALCGCSCDATLSLIDLWNNGGENIPINLRELVVNEDASCTDLKAIFKRQCETDNVISFKNSILIDVEPNNYLTNEEIELITSLLNSVIANDYDFQDFETQWESLPTISDLDNSISQLLIEMAKSLEKHENNNPELWNQLPDAPGEPKVSKWINKLIGAAGGALSGVLATGVNDVTSNFINGVPQHQSNLTNTNVAVGAAWGALTGAAAAF